MGEHVAHTNEMRICTEPEGKDILDLSYLHLEDGDSMILRNIFPHQYTLKMEQHDPPKHWYPTTTLYGVRTQKTST
jgi:hypothetical protein